MKQAYDSDGNKVDYAIQPDDYVIDDGIVWTAGKRQALKELLSLVDKIALIEDSNNFIENIKSCIDQAQGLRYKKDILDISFVEFLKDYVITQYKKEKVICLQKAPHC